MARFNAVPVKRADGTTVYRNPTQAEKNAIASGGASAARQVYGVGSGGTIAGTTSGAQQTTNVQQTQEQQANAQREAQSKSANLKALEDAKRQNLISAKAYEELKFNIQNSEQIKEAVEQARRQRAQNEQQRSQVIAQIQQQGPAPVASSILATTRSLPSSFQTPETQKAVAQYSQDLAGAREGFKTAYSNIANTQGAKEFSEKANQGKDKLKEFITGIKQDVSNTLPDSFEERIKSGISADIERGQAVKDFIVGKTKEFREANPNLRNPQEDIRKAGAPVLDPVSKFLGTSTEKLRGFATEQYKDSFLPSFGYKATPNPLDEFVQPIKNKNRTEASKESTPLQSGEEQGKGGLVTGFKNVALGTGDFLSKAKNTILGLGADSTSYVTEFGQFVAEKPVAGAAFITLPIVAPTAGAVVAVGAVGKMTYDAGPLGPRVFAGNVGALGIGALASKGAGKVKQEFFTDTKADIITDVITPTKVIVEQLKSTGKQSPSLRKLDTPLGEISLRQDTNSLIFEYPRQKVTERTEGFNEPPVAVSRGRITRGNNQFDLISVQIGRDVIGVLKGEKEDVLLSKSQEGKMEATTFNKGDILIDESMPIPLFKLSEGATMRQKIVRDFQPEKMSMRQEQQIGTAEIEKDIMKLGIKEGENEIFPFSMVKQEGRFSLVGEQQDFIGGRDIKKAFMGQAETRLLQRDVAGLQTEITIIGKDKLFDFKLPNIEYVIQPTYESAIKIFSTETTPDGIQTVTKFTNPPSLETTRINEFASSSRYSFERSGIKPLKSIYKGLEPFTQIPEDGPLFSSFGIPMTTGRVKTEIGLPEFNLLEPQRRSSFSAEDIMGVIPRGRTESRLFSMFDFESDFDVATRNAQRIVPELKSDLAIFSEIKSRTKSELDINNILNIRPEIRTESKARTETMTQLNVLNELRTESKARTETKGMFGSIARSEFMVPSGFILPMGFDGREPSNKAYDVYVRRGDKRGDKFVKVADNLPRNRALNFGAGIVDNYIEASFRIRQDGTTKKEDDFFQPDLTKFERPRTGTKLPGDTFIEKKGKRLDTFGEVQQISYFKQKAGKGFSIF